MQQQLQNADGIILTESGSEESEIESESETEDEQLSGQSNITRYIEEDRTTIGSEEGEGQLSSLSQAIKESKSLEQQQNETNNNSTD